VFSTDWWASEIPPTWFAVLFAAAAAYIAWRTYRRERRRDEAQQASLVTIWPDKDRRDNPRFAVLNGSSAPVWSLVVFPHYWDRTKKGVPHQRRPAIDVGVTPPSGTPRYFDTGLDAVDYDKTGYLFAVEFRDSANETWHRTPGGVLGRGLYPERDLFGEPLRPLTPGHGTTA
jgi:hypothetical protein